MVSLPAMTFTTAVLAAACCALAGAARAQAFAYAPGEHQYRVTSAIKRTQAVGDREVNDSAVSVQVISLALARQAKDTLRFTYTVDSVWATIPEVERLLAGMRGKRVTGTMSPLGDVYTFQVPADSASPMGGQEFRSFRSFLIRFPSGTLRPGQAWTDTVTATLGAAGLDGTETTILTSRVVGDTTVAGQTAWRVERTATATLSGSGTRSGQQFVLEGSRAVAGESYVSRSGVYLGSVSTQEGETVMMVVGSNRSLAVIQTATTHIERVPPRPTR